MFICAIPGFVSLFLADLLVLWHVFWFKCWVGKVIELEGNTTSNDNIEARYSRMSAHLQISNLLLLQQIWVVKCGGHRGRHPLYWQVWHQSYHYHTNKLWWWTRWKSLIHSDQMQKLCGTSRLLYETCQQLLSRGGGCPNNMAANTYWSDVEIRQCQNCNMKHANSFLVVEDDALIAW